MRLLIQHHTTYRYEQAVHFCPHRVRLFPRPETGRSLRRWEFVTTPSAQVYHRRDLFDNSVAHCVYAPQPANELTFRLRSELEVAGPVNPFDFLVDHAAAWFPFVYPAAETLRLAPYLPDPAAARPPALLPLPFWKGPVEGMPTVELLVELTRAIPAYLRYETRKQGAARPAAETIRLGWGACRDFALLQIAVLRELGLAARLVSGYLARNPDLVWPDDGPENDPAARGQAMHAWIEAYLPGAGWTGWDPTHGVACNHRYVATAVGREAVDVAPVTGLFTGPRSTAAELTTRVEVRWD